MTLNILCSYGCGQIAKHINKSNKPMCSPSHNQCPINKTKNSNALTKAHRSGLRDQQKIYQNLSTEIKEKMLWNKGNINPDFSYEGKGNHKGYLIRERGHKCECCNNSLWLNIDITLELEHSDGNNKNNVKENLKLLCPNCHSQTPTWRGRKNHLFTHKGKNYKNKQLLINERGHKCENCNNSLWLNINITLELEHIDGNNKNNAKENLKLLCPNCHAQTPTWRGYNTKVTGKRKHTEDTIIQAIQESKNMYQALTKLDYRYGSKDTVLRVMQKYNLSFKN